MFYEVGRGHGLPHDPFYAIVAPRPIGWISTMSREGAVNLAPYSFFNAISTHPHLVAFSSQGRKDSLTFAEEGGEFVYNFASWELREKVNLTSTPLPRGENEMAAFGIAAAPSRLVRPPRVADAPAALECKWVNTVDLHTTAGEKAGYSLVIGEVVAVYIRDDCLVDGRVDTGAMRPILRGGYSSDYFAVGPENHFAMPRPRGGGNRFDP